MPVNHPPRIVVGTMPSFNLDSAVAMSFVTVTDVDAAVYPNNPYVSLRVTLSSDLTRTYGVSKTILICLQYLCNADIHT